MGGLDENHCNVEDCVESDAVRVLLQGLGKDVAREGLRKTPLRVAKSLRERTRGMPPHFKQTAQRKSFGKKDSRGKGKKNGDSAKSNSMPSSMKKSEADPVKLKSMPGRSRKNVEPKADPVEIKSSGAARTKRLTRNSKTVDVAGLKQKPTQKGVKRKLDSGGSIPGRLSKKTIRQEEVVEEPELKPKKEMKEEGDQISGFAHRCRPVRFISFCKSLTDEQKSAVRDIGFGGLLFLNFGRCHILFLKWLCSNFNGTSRMFRIDSYRSFVITEEDVCDAFSLPLSDLSIDDRCSRDEHSEFLNHYRLKYELSGRVSLSKLTSVCLSLKESGDDFKRLFVLFAVNTFLAPPSNQLVKVPFLSKLIDVSSISRLNWCGFVLKTLCHASNIFRRGESIYYPGCCLLLVVLYFHRVKWQGVLAQQNLPLIRHWTQKQVSNRSKMEYEAGFGQGILISDIYPISKKVTAVGDDERELVVDEKEAIGDEKGKAVSDGGKEDEEKESVGDDGQGETFLKFILGKNDIKDSDINKMATDQENEILLLLKRDLAVVTSYRFGQLLMMKNYDQSFNSENSQKYFEQESVLKLIDEIVEKFKKMNNADKSMSTFHILAPPSPNNDRTADSPKDVKKLADKFVFEEASTCVENDDVAGDAAPGVGFSNIEDVLQFDGVSFLTPIANKKATETELSDAMTSGGRNIVSMCKKSTTAHNFWAIDQEIGYVSKFIRCHRNVLDSMQQNERELLDYVFSTDLYKKNKHETLFSASVVYVIGREDMISLFPNTSVFCSVLRAWSLVVNNYEGPCRTRFSFSMDHSESLAKFLKIVEKFSKKKCVVVKAKGRGRRKGRGEEDFAMEEEDEEAEETANIVDKKAAAEKSITKLSKLIMNSWDIFLGRNIRDFAACEMVFFPIYLHKHYILLVANFVEKKFQYLDNLHREEEDNDYMKACKFLVAVFRKFAKEKNHPCFEELSNFDIEIVSLPSHARNLRNLDCAISVMHHMMNFDGSPSSTPDLTKAAIRHALRAQMCCTIILHQLNTIRDSVLEKVYKFYLEKPYLINDGKCWKN